MMRAAARLTTSKPGVRSLTRKALIQRMRYLLGSFPRFTSQAGQISLYRYQHTPAAAILDSVRRNLGLTFVLILPRQSGKDELMCQLKVYLMRLLSGMDRSMVEVNPTYKPQTINAILRLENRLNSNRLTRGQWGKRSDHTWFVLKYLLGYPNVRLYDGSWAEWSTLVGVPVER